MTAVINPFSLAGHNIVVVGASGGIGRACAAALRGCGAQVLPVGRDAAKLKDLVHEGRVTSTLDFEVPDSFASWAAALPQVHGVVFATGVAPVRPFMMVDRAQWEQVMRLNVHGPMLAVRELLRARKLHVGFSLVFIGSIAAHRGTAGYSAYSASKGALSAGVRCLAAEVAVKGGRANVVSPGLIQTEMAKDLGKQMTEAQAADYARRYPLGLGRPEDVANAVAYLLSPAARWITGSEIIVDGGVTLA